MTILVCDKCKSQFETDKYGEHNEVELIRIMVWSRTYKYHVCHNCLTSMGLPTKNLMSASDPATQLLNIMYDIAREVSSECDQD